MPVVIFHGLGCDSTMMKGCLEPVFTCKSGYKRIYIDLPGMSFFDWLMRIEKYE